MSTFTQAQVDAAVEAARAEERQKAEAAEAKNKTLEFQARCRYHQGMVDRLISDDARLTPAQGEGLAEFMAQLERVEANEFEFTVGDGDDAKTTKATLSDFFGAFIAQLPKQLELGRGIAGHDSQRTTPASNFSGQAVDPDRAALDQRARDYMAAHPGTDYVTAVATCENQ